MKKLFVFLVFITQIFCASLVIKNDSQFHLIAVIYNAAGQREGSINLRPGQSHMWYGGNFYDPFKKQLNQPYAPYTVVWQCNEHQSSNTKGSDKKERTISEFGTWNNVAVGSTITAMGCPLGNKSCTITKKKEKPGEYKPSHKDSENDGFNNFSNDGGQTWTNDGGPPPNLDDDD